MHQFLNAASLNRHYNPDGNAIANLDPEAVFQIPPLSRDKNTWRTLFN
jgi:hypothetical protein